MKGNYKISLFCLSFIIVCILAACSAADSRQTGTQNNKEQQTNVYFNGTQVRMEALDIINDYPFADPEPLLKMMGAESEWDSEKSTLSVFYKDSGASFQKGNKYANNNGSALELPDVPYMKNNKLWIPLNSLGEALSCNVDWNRRQACIAIETKDYNSPALTDHTQQQKPVDASKAGKNTLVGLWSSRIDSTGVILDSAGMPAGDIYTGEWYRFDEDGGFLYVIVGSGMVIKGGVVQKGQYRIDGKKIYVTNVTESWYPAPEEKTEAYKDKAMGDITLEFRIEISEDGTAVYLKDIESSYEHKFYLSN